MLPRAALRSCYGYDDAVALRNSQDKKLAVGPEIADVEREWEEPSFEEFQYDWGA